jgi:MiaB-like tRNA modifying enzyme
MKTNLLYLLGNIMKVFIKTYGCTLNQTDSDAMKGLLLANGVEIVQEEGSANVIILNTCTVKSQTQQKIIEKLKKLNGKKIVVAGCLVSANRELVEKYAASASLVGTSSISDIYDAVQASYRNKKKVFINQRFENKLSLPRLRDNIIAKIPISEGCLSKCSFCSTKFARAGLHSYDEEAIISEIRNCIELGCKEIQITSQDTGAYGSDKNTNIAKLINKVDKIEGDFSVRMGMINPQHAIKILPELIDAFKSSKIYKFLHVPVQSGNNEVLRDMGRFYTVENFQEIVKEFRDNFKEVTIATDIIMGYPTESEGAFQDTLNLLEKAKPDVVNVSRFTPRPNTPAAKLKQLPNESIKERTKIASELCKKIELEINKKLIGSEYKVLLTEKQNGSITGRNPSYKQVVVNNGDLGDFIKVKIVDATYCYLKGVELT